LDKNFKKNMASLRMYMEWADNNNGDTKYKVLIYRGNDPDEEMLEDEITRSKLKNIGVEMIYHGWDEWDDLPTIIKVIKYFYDNAPNDYYKLGIAPTPELIADQRKEKIALALS
jgi:hypothetical protein